MTTSELIERSEKIYQERYKAELERTHPNYFVAIEPDSGDFFLGRTLSEAAAAARAVHPGRRTGVVRVGHLVALHIGASVGL